MQQLEVNAATGSQRSNLKSMQKLAVNAATGIRQSNRSRGDVNPVRHTAASDKNADSTTVEPKSRNANRKAEKQAERENRKPKSRIKKL